MRIYTSTARTRGPVYTEHMFRTDNPEVDHLVVTSPVDGIPLTTLRITDPFEPAPGVMAPGTTAREYVHLDMAETRALRDALTEILGEWD